MAHGGQLFVDGWLPVDACLFIHGVNYNTDFGNLQVFLIFVTGRIIPAFLFCLNGCEHRIFKVNASCYPITELLP